jgi:hypothetical protein
MAIQTSPDEQNQSELRRVLDSDTFRHSDSLRRLLTYLGEKSIPGASAEGLKEYTIGVEAFNKPQDYDPQHDPSVRVLASKLRHKLDEYYGTEGAGNPVRIEIPRGHYELRYHPQVAGHSEASENSLNAEVRKWKRLSVAIGGCLLLTVAVAVAWRSAAHGTAPPGPPAATGWTPELEMIWSPFLDGDHPPLISLGTPLFAKLGRDFFRNPRVNEWEEALESEQLKQLQSTLRADAPVPAYPYTGVGEATGAFLLCKLLYPRRQDLTIQRNNTLSWETLRASDVIFLGPPKFNLHLKDISTEGGFVIDRGAIRNLRPKPGEPDAYRSTWSDNQLNLLEDYALIHRLPGLNDRGDVMVLASASTEGTWAAVECVTDPAFAKALVDKLRQPSGGLPRNFQAVLRVEFRQQVPWRITYVTHRILQQHWAPKPPER